MNTLADLKRTVESALDEAGFANCVVEPKLDGDNKPFVAITHAGRTADGPLSLVLSAIQAAKTDGITLNDAFKSRNMYADAI